MLLDNKQLELGQVQADEIKAKTQKGSIWMTMASTRLWLGWAVSTYLSVSFRDVFRTDISRSPSQTGRMILVELPNILWFRIKRETGQPVMVSRPFDHSLLCHPNKFNLNLLIQKLFRTYQ
jgi:hypothetical protein